MEVILKGNDKNLSKFLKVNSLYMKRKGITFEKVKKDEPKLTANEVAELIAKIESIEDLKQYESDTRQIVGSAYKKKLKEFE